jgi:ABC-2 type transport system ATP-binding protein
VETTQPVIIQLDELSRHFGEVRAVHAMSLEIQKGELFGLVGPDGAGKTTLLRTLAGLLSLTEGSGMVAGLDLKENPERIKRQIGYMAQQFGLYAELNVVENLLFFADLFDVPKNEITGRMDSLLEFANLTEFKQRRADRLSGGMQKKLALACCLIHAPEILLLDEPTTGVDPVSRREFWNILGELHLRGTTIVVSTPYMDEADRCSRVGLMYQGEMIRCAPPAEIRGAVSSEMLVLIPETDQDLSAVLEQVEGVHEVQVYGDAYHILVDDAGRRKRRIEKKLRRENIKIKALYVSMPKMEQAFISLVKQLE